MTAKKKNEKPRSKVPDELKGLADEFATYDRTDKASIVKAGTELEKVWTTLKVDGASKGLVNLLKKCLTTLQALYQDKLTDATLVWSGIEQAVRASENRLDGAEDGPAQIKAAMSALKELSDAPAAAPAPAAQPEQPAAEEIENVLGAIEGIAAKLMSYAPEETKELGELREDLLKIVSCSNLAGGAVGNLTIAASQIETVVQGKTENAEEALTAAAEALGIAAEVQETSQEQDSTGDEAEAPPAGEVATESETTAEEPPAAKEESPPQTEEPKVVQAQPAPEAEEKPKTAKFEFATPAVMPEDTDNELLSEYIIESLDHITNAEGSLLELESVPEDKEQIDVVFRAYHTIKGTSGFLGFDRIQRCAHLAENLLDRARDGQIKLKGGYADLCLRSCDNLRVMLEGLQGIAPGDPLVIPDDLGDLLDILTDPEAAGFSDTLDDSNEQMRVGDILVAKGEATRKTIESAEKKKGDKKLGEQLIETGKVKATQVVDAIRTQNQVKQGATVEGTIRVGTGRLDSLINMVGELVIAQSMVAADPDVARGAKPRLQRSVSHAGKIIRELQDHTMSLRMVPLKGVFQKMNRLVRDLGRKSGKKVVFVTEGEETEIDRNMVESLNDPLVHMIRNSVDHGIEVPEVRSGDGKDETGTVTLRAFHAAGNVVIELQDDGKGLDRQKILSKAIEKGIVDKNRDMTDNEVFMLIFAAGFSTADQVTDVSGRGVGMDVVRRNIEAIRGRIEIASKAGQGSTFTVRLPLTMAITDAMILRVGEDRFLLPTASIEQSFQPDEKSISTVTGQGEMVMLRGELLPLFRLHKLFNLDQAEEDVYSGLLVVIEGSGKRCALMVDELLGQQQVVIKSLGEGMAKVPGIAGGAILGDGRVGLILDATGLLQLAEGETSDEMATEGAMAF